jgi:hypothetical protein
VRHEKKKKEEKGERKAVLFVFGEARGTPTLSYEVGRRRHKEGAEEKSKVKEKKVS